MDIDIVHDELIGRRINIVACTDPTWIQKSGVVIDETKHTFIIEIKGKRKRIAKETATFEFDYHGKKIIVEGKRLMYRPEDRIKKAR
ncbi:MAG: ribonuclease P protein subunit [Candidatus Thermoplasmatota archaeon]